MTDYQPANVENFAVTAELEMDYVLYVSGKPESTHKSLQDAKDAAKSYLDRRLPVAIERIVAPVPSSAPKEIWEYKYALSGWSRRQ